MAGIYIPGLISLIVFYLLILGVGIFAAWYKTRKRIGADGSDTVIVASRDIGLFVGAFTMTATWVGGGYINGTAEYVYKYGIIWAQAPIGYAFSLIIGGLFFAERMRKKRYLTMLDPFQEKYGSRIGGILYLPALCGELFWSAAILNALGSSVSVIMELDFQIAVVVSACIAVFYTFFGGLYSVAYTDVIQLICVAFGLTLCVPFAWFNPNVHMGSAHLLNGTNLTDADTKWIGTIPSDQIWTYIDNFLLLICGGLPWQVYFQRVLSVSDAWKAKALSFCGAFGCIIMVVPAVLIGIVAQRTEWNSTELLDAGLNLDHFNNNTQAVLPYVLRYLTPTAVSFFGLGAVSAAVMSSSDSSILSASSMFAHNIYKMIFRQQASDKEIVWVLRVAIVFCGAIATVIGLTVKSVYALWFLSSDFVYVTLFPQLVAVIYIPFVNSYGVISGFFFGLLLRLLGGDKDLGLPATIPFGDFPFKTLSMLVNFAVTLLISLLAMLLFKRRRVFPMKYDVFNAFSEENLNPKKLWQVPIDSRKSLELEAVSDKPPLYNETYGNMGFSEKEKF